MAAGLIGFQGQARDAPPTASDRFVESDNGWRTYVNGRFGLRVSFPSEVFAAADAPADGSGRRFESGLAAFEAFGWDNAKRETSATLATSLIGSEGYEHVERQEVTDTELVISGQRGDRAFLERYVFRGSTVQAFGMEYPVQSSSEYAPLAAAIAATFLHGADAAGTCGGEFACQPIDDRPDVEASTVAAVQPPLAKDGDYFRIVKSKAAKGKKSAKVKKLKKAKGKKPNRGKLKSKGRGKGRKK